MEPAIRVEQVDLNSVDSVKTTCRLLSEYYYTAVPDSKFIDLQLLKPGTKEATDVKARISWKDMYCTGLSINNVYQEINVTYPLGGNFDLIMPSNLGGVLSKMTSEDCRNLAYHIAFLLCEGARFGDWWIDTLFYLNKKERSGLKIPQLSLEAANGVPPKIKILVKKNNPSHTILFDVSHCWSNISSESNGAQLELLTIKRPR